MVKKKFECHIYFLSYRYSKCKQMLAMLVDFSYVFTQRTQITEKAIVKYAVIQILFLKRELLHILKKTNFEIVNVFEVITLEKKKMKFFHKPIK